MTIDMTGRLGQKVPFEGENGSAAYWLAEVAPGPDGVRAGRPCRIVFARCEGHLTVSELLSFFALIAQDEEIDNHLPTFWDMRDHDFSEVSTVFARSLAYALARVPERAGVRRAFVVSDEDGFATMRLFQQVVSGLGIDSEESFLVATEVEGALDWLCAP